MHGDDNRLNLPKREEKILEFWERNKIFEKTLAKTKNGRLFVFYEGPPYANGLPGIHHFLGRAFKDIVIRYRAMRGFFAPRKAGWDTHGLPIEIVVEKKLGITSKKEIEERVGINRFIDEARKNVFFYKEEWERFTKRIGYWLDLPGAYMTMSTDYIETLWWIVKEIWKKGLLYQDFKVVPWCPRCQTGLSTHELGFGYKTVKDRSVYVKFRIKSSEPRWAKTAILSWTTTPWTLPGNVALAINPKEDYVCIPDPDVKQQWLILGQRAFRGMVEKYFFPPEYRSSLMLDDIDTFKGKDIAGLVYEPLFAVKELAAKNSHRIYAADFVTTEEGTGVVHTAVMYGEDDYRLGKKIGLPAFHTVTETGHFIKELGEGLGGLYVKDSKTEDKIIASLKRHGLLFKEELYEHEYPFCWRCDTALLYYARRGWWIKMSAVKKKLIANNETINWVPETIKHGRFGEFLNEVRDWALSRERYWGTPLPIWNCGDCGKVEVVGSLEEFSGLAFSSGNRYFAMRHGQSETQMLGIADDDKNTFHLTPGGREEVLSQAKRLGKEKIDLIVSSPILRARETAEIVSKAIGGAKVATDRRLREIHVGVFEHKPVNQYHEYFFSDLEKFTKRPPEGESLNDLKARLMSLMEDLEKKYRGKKILLISHEYPIWILWGSSQGLSNKAMVAIRERQGKDFIKTGEALKIPFRPLPRNNEGDIDLHRPFVDAFALTCPKCRAIMRRVPEVADVWFDSGAMPFAQHHYPFEHRTDLSYPADYICEGVDMTRGWFYTLLAVASALGRAAPYRNVISLGLVLDRNSKKMSKSRGNVVEPNAMIDKYGSDAIRWYFYTINAPGDPKRFDEKDLALKLRGPLATFWNSFVFFDTYVDKTRNPKPLNGRARRALAETRNKSQVPNPKHVLDQWVMAKLEELTGEVTMRLESYDIVGAARLLEGFIIDDFSNWYLRRSRRRFQKPESKAEKEEAAGVTAFVLSRLADLMAPFTPFLSEIIYQELKKKLGLKEESVHLRAWPKPETPKRASSPGFSRNPKSLTRPSRQALGETRILLAGMDEVRRLATLALAERAKAGIKVRQPLAKLKVKNKKLKITGLLDVLADEVNVKEIVIDPKISGEVELDTAISSELREEGLMRELVRNIQEMRRDAGLKPQEGIRCQVIGDSAVTAIVERWKKFIQKEAGAKAIQLGGKKSFAVEREIKLDGGIAWIGIRKV